MKIPTANQNHFGQLTQSIIDEALRRNIPCIRLTDSPVIQLGYGANQQRIQKSFTTFTGIIGVKQSSNKDQAKTLLHSMGVPVPIGKVINEPSELARAIAAVGYPVVIKPLSGNNGRGVGVNILSFEDALDALKVAKGISKSGQVIIEKYIAGLDYRLLVINNKFVAAAKRTPAMVIGNGRSTIGELIDIVNSDPRRGDGHSKPLTIIKVDQVTVSILKRKGLTLKTILPANEPLFLKDIANLSAGGTSADLTDVVHPDNVLAAERIAKIIGLDVCGMDIISPDISIPFSENNAAVVEVNSAPGLRLHMEPTEGKPRNVAAPIIDMLFPPGSSPLIPIIAVSGSKGTLQACSFIAAILATTGAQLGCATSKGIHIQNILLPRKDLDHHERVELVLKDPTVNAAIFECASRDILKAGPGFPNCDVGIVINTDDLATKAITEFTSNIFPAGYAVLNADYSNVYKLRKGLACNIALFSLSENNPYVTMHVATGGYAAFIEDGYFTVYNGIDKIRLIKVKDIPNSDIPFKQAVLASILTGVICNINADIICNSLNQVATGMIKKPALCMNTQAGINYLVNCIKEDGSFIYEIDARTGVISKSYNILRHAGALYILYQWFGINKEDNRIHLLDLATSYLKKQARPLKNNPGLNCIVEKGNVKLGGSALALLAFVEKYNISPSADELAFMRSLAGFIVWMQESTGKFRSKFSYMDNEPSDFESTYYPGEAILALTNFYKIDPNPLWIKTAGLGIDYLIKNPVKNSNGTHGHNHWLATALAAYNEIDTNNISVYNELWQITNATIKSMENNYMNGGNSYTYSSAEMATRGETILAALNLEKKLGKTTEIERLTAELNKVIDHCLQFQIDKSIIFNTININGGIKKSKKDSRIRIDNVQHAMQVLTGFQA